HRSTEPCAAIPPQSQLRIPHCHNADGPASVQPDQCVDHPPVVAAVFIARIDQRQPPPGLGWAQGQQSLESIAMMDSDTAVLTQMMPEVFDFGGMQFDDLKPVVSPQVGLNRSEEHTSELQSRENLV